MPRLQKEWTEALNYFQAALQYQPGMPKIHLAMAAALANQGKLDDAKT